MPIKLPWKLRGQLQCGHAPIAGDCPVSYPVPTASAVRGIFESILWGPAIRIIPTRADICTPLQYHAYHTNYGGPLRSSGSIKSGSSFQFLATVLIDVCYRLYADVLPATEDAKTKWPYSATQWDQNTSAPGHAYQAIFTRRLKRGQCFSVPCLGWKEFTPSYFGGFRAETVVQADISTSIPTLLKSVFPDYNSARDFQFIPDAHIRNGVCEYEPRENGHVE